MLQLLPSLFCRLQLIRNVLMYAVISSAEILFMSAFYCSLLTYKMRVCREVVQ